MNDFLNSLKADLLDRRLLPLFGLVLVALLAAVGYAVTGGGGSSTPPVGGRTPVASGTGGLVASQAQPKVSQAVAETTNGGPGQSKGPAHDPFAAIPGANKAPSGTAPSVKGTAAAGTAAAGSGSAGSSTPSTASKGTTPTTPAAPAAPSKPAAPAKPKTIYSVSLQFSPVAAAAHNYAGLTKATPLPSAKEKLIEFLGVTVTSKSTSAAFLITGEEILSGEGSCLPSALQCKMIDLKEGRSEKVEFISPTGAPVAYELRVVKIASTTASAARVKTVLRAQRRTERELLRSGGILKVAGLHYSSQAGVLLFNVRRAFGARAHGALAHRRHGG
jgi:hypothetical protein